MIENSDTKVKVSKLTIYLDIRLIKIMEEIIDMTYGDYPTLNNIIVNCINNHESVFDLWRRAKDNFKPIEDFDK